MAVVKLTPQFSKQDIANYVKAQILKFEEVVFDMFVELGEEFVAEARQTNTYKDRTGNLRGSIGYTLLKNGKSVFGNFDGDEISLKNSKKLIRKLSKEYKKGYVLIVVAGMNYAAAVESKGYDVITGSSQLTEVLLEKYIARLKESLSKLRK